MILCLNGHPRSGKTTIAKELIKTYGFKEVPLNLPFRNFVLDCLGYSRESYNVLKDSVLPDKGGKDTTIRQLMIDTADLMEEYDPSIWSHLALRTVLENDPSFEGRWVLDSIGKVAQYNHLKSVIPEDHFYLIKPVREPHRDTDIYEDGRDNIKEAKNKFLVDNTSTIQALMAQIDAVAIKVLK